MGRLHPIVKVMKKQGWGQLNPNETPKCLRKKACELSLAFRNSGHTVLNYLSNIGATQKGNKYGVPRIPFAIL
jgi:hypothetical protein